MKYVKFVMMAVALLGAILSLSYGVLDAGGHGVMVIVACLVPFALGAFGTFVQPGIPRWAAAVSAVSFLIVAMKTSGGPDGGDLENVMMIGALGLVLAIVLCIKPDRRK